VRPLADGVYVLTEAAQVDQLRRLLPEVESSHYIVEPVARGTTSAYGLAAMTIGRRDPEAVLACFPADHVVTKPAQFRSAIRSATKLAAAGEDIVLIGLEPTHPSTGLGYIHAAGAVQKAGVSARRVSRFVEKPDLDTAREFVADGNYFWNLAMFTYRADVLEAELRAHAPVHHRGLKRVLEARAQRHEEAAARAYAKLPSDAIDYTVMEHSRRLLLVPARFGWADIGAWPELAGLRRADRDGNVTEGATLLLDSHENLVLAGDKLVAAIGVEDLVVVEAENAILICPRSRAQEVKRVVEELRRRGLTEYL
jgi:mannose-1-phosphate guanylyltransferase